MKNIRANKNWRLSQERKRQAVTLFNTLHQINDIIKKK